MGRWEVPGGIPQRRAIQQAVRALQAGEVILYPTDTTYAIGGLISKKSAFDRVCQIRGIRPEKSLFSVFLPNVAAIGQYALGLDTPTYRLLRQLWPGPYTVILRPGPAIPRHLWYRRTVGFRISDFPFLAALLAEVQEPLLTAGVPEEQFELYAKQVSEAFDAGPLSYGRTTVIDLSEGLEHLRVLRVGLGSLEPLEPFLAE